jgi:outer membrane lipoprotein-sorting protein
MLVATLAGTCLAADLTTSNVLAQVTAERNKVTTVSAVFTYSVLTDDMWSDFTLKFRQKGAQKMRVEYTAPKDTAGTQVILNGNQFWLYYPKVAKPQKMELKPGQGSNGMNPIEVTGFLYQYLSYAGQDLSREYKVKSVKKEKLGSTAAWLCEFLPTSKAPTFSRQRVWFRDTNLAPIKLELYDRTGRLTVKASVQEILLNVPLADSLFSGD